MLRKVAFAAGVAALSSVAWGQSQEPVRAKEPATARAYVGVGVQRVDQDLARALGIEPGSGDLVRSLLDGGPAERAGLQVGDLIVAVDGKPITPQRDAVAGISEQLVGAAFTVTVVRDGQQRSVQIIPMTRPSENLVGAEQQRFAMGKRSSAPPADGPADAAGMTLLTLTPEIAGPLGVPPEAAGAVIKSIASDTAAAELGLKRGDVILRVGSADIGSSAEAARLIEQALGGPRESALLYIMRGKKPPAFVALRSVSKSAEINAAKADIYEFQYGSLTMPDDGNRFVGVAKPAVGPLRASLYSCAPNANVRIAGANVESRDVRSDGLYVTTLTARSVPSSLKYHVRAGTMAEVGQPYMFVWMVGGKTLSPIAYEALKPKCATSANLTDADILRRFGDFARRAGKTVTGSDGAGSYAKDYEWVVRGQSLKVTKRTYGSKYWAASNVWLYSWDEKNQKLWSQSVYDASPSSWSGNQLTPAKIVAWQADRAEQQASSGGGGGLLGALQGAVAGIQGVASGGGGLSEGLAGAAIGGVAGAAGVDAGTIGTAMGSVDYNGSGSSTTGLSQRLGNVAAASGGVAGAKDPVPMPGCDAVGVNSGNYRSAALSGGNDVQLKTMCGQAYEYYAMYRRALEQGYSEADAERTYQAHAQSAAVANDFYDNNRAN